MLAVKGNKNNCPLKRLVASAFAGSVVFGTLLQVGGAPAFGEEYEAPTVFTGESVMVRSIYRRYLLGPDSVRLCRILVFVIFSVRFDTLTDHQSQICKRRGPLGACLETVARTEENDNDKAKKYFRDPTALLKEKEALMRESNDEGNLLIQKLRQQSRDNQEKNDLYVQRKTFENDQSGYMGPFDRQVLIMNTDGKTFTMLQTPQAMRLKDSGFIVDRRFVKQPTDEELEQALIAESTGLVGVIQGIFGGASSE
jgi:hypothetical protein